MNNRPHDELKQIALDIHHGRIFTNLHLAPGDYPSLVFLPLSLLDHEHIQQLQNDPPGLIFEYIDQAGPRFINGYPGFFSMQFLSPDDAEKVIEMVRKLQETEQEALATP